MCSHSAPMCTSDTFISILLVCYRIFFAVRVEKRGVQSHSVYRIHAFPIFANVVSDVHVICPEYSLLPAQSANTKIE